MVDEENRAMQKGAAAVNDNRIQGSKGEKNIWDNTMDGNEKQVSEEAVSLLNKHKRDNGIIDIGAN